MPKVYASISHNKAPEEIAVRFAYNEYFTEKHYDVC
jgi:hypothetical protein